MEEGVGAGAKNRKPYEQQHTTELDLKTTVGTWKEAEASHFRTILSGHLQADLRRHPVSRHISFFR